MESLAFEYTNDSDKNNDEEEKEKTQKEEDPNNCICIEGGTEQLVTALITKLEPKKVDKDKVLNKAVLKMKLDRERSSDDKIVVEVKGEQKPRFYNAVINTTTLAALQKMDLSEMELPYGLKAAIRSLRYDTSTKVGMKFNYPWWIKDFKIKGGLGKTDLPLRTW